MGKISLNKKQRRRVSGIMRRLERVRILLSEISEQRIVEVVDLKEQTEPDGYKSDTRLLAHVSGSSGGSSTEAAALSRRDTLEQLIKFVERNSTIADVALAEIVNALNLPFVDEEKYRGRQRGESCLICKVLPAELSGFCKKHYNNWEDHGRPDRHRWMLFLSQERNSEGLLLVPDTPPPSPGQVARRGPFREGWEPTMVETWTPGPDRYTA